MLRHRFIAIILPFSNPIVNKRVSVTPISMLVGVSGGDPVLYAKTLDKVAKANSANIKILKFVRYETGEGIEKKQEDFAAEVAKQMGN